MVSHYRSQKKVSPSSLAAGVLCLMLSVLFGCSATHVATTQTTPAVSINSLPQIHARAIIIMRHGDIDVEQKHTLGDQTQLTATGQDRAKALAYALREAGVTRIVATETLRTQQTAQPLADALHLKIEIPLEHGTNGVRLSDADFAQMKKREAAELVRYLAASCKSDDVVLIVNHHSIIPTILGAFGFSHEARFSEDVDFNRAYVLLPRSTGGYDLLRLHYGGTWGDQIFP